MTKLSAYLLAIAMCLGTTAMLGINRIVKPADSEELRLASDGAFRDGLYLGKLAAERGQLSRPAIGRWSTDQDRSMFLAGYRRGSNESSARARASAAHSLLAQ
jgi:hypothetical protein